ncbi:MAG: hypothetical protein HYZ53_15250 [Planctomycetes bacterium]|nr:hypothetical protein [Planctomycetota bacterium]
MRLSLPALIVLVPMLAVAASGPALAQEPNPYPRPVVASRAVRAWTFEADGSADGWEAAHHCRVEAVAGALRIHALGPDPYLHSPAIDCPPGPALLTLRLASSGAGSGQCFWTTRESPTWDEEKSVRFPLAHDGVPHDYSVPLPVAGTLFRLRLDPGDDAGECSLDSLELRTQVLHPLEVVRVEASDSALSLLVKTHATEDVTFEFQHKAYLLRPGQQLLLEAPLTGRSPFEAVPLQLLCKSRPPLRRPVFVFREDAQTDWVVRESEGVRLRLARDGSGARLEMGNLLVAAVAPLVHCDGEVPRLALREEGEELLLAGDGVRVALALRAGELTVRIDADRPCEGPVLRALGGLEQGLLAGLEYLGKRERSSSTLDIETAEHVRYAPDPLQVTMPLMACVTERGAAAITWSDLTLQPVFAAPNFFDGASDDHRMALRGRRIEAAIAVRRATLPDLILWAVKRRGLPPLPAAPRDPEAQRRLCLAAFDGPLKGGAGWGHCAEPNWGRAPYSDHASTLWRLTGNAPALPALTDGGAHVRNDAIWFVLGRAKEWLALRSAEARAALGREAGDGSFRYAGKYLKGHFEDTASGICAASAVRLLEFARLTGDADARAGGLRSLEFMKRFRTPRGAQTWELSLHTPDLLASAHLTAAYVLGYELTGAAEHLERARAWALSGLPFVYLRSDRPVMAYATVPVYGATNWTAPNWIGTPVQWCGSVYAKALLSLAPHDTTLDWRRIAEGITLAGEQMQYPEGPRVGCLPDVYFLPTQSRAGPSINPCALVSLRLALAGQPAGLSVAVSADGAHRVVAPFPVELRDGSVVVHARKGVAYQVLIDGGRVVDVDSQGEDALPLR